MTNSVAIFGLAALVASTMSAKAADLATPAAAPATPAAFHLIRYCSG